MIALRAFLVRAALGWALVGPVALAAGADAPPEPPPCPECQWHLPKGWKFDSARLRGPEASFEFSVVPETPEAAATTALEVEPEVARLVDELGQRGLVPKEPIGRVVTTALGEPTILIEYALVPKAGEVLPAARGARLVRRCGSTATFDLFADPAEPQKLSKAASVISWARPECARFNRTPFVGADPVPSVELAAVVPPPPPPPQQAPGGEGIPWALLAGFGAVGLVASGAIVAYNRLTYRRLPPINVQQVAEPVAVAFAPERPRQAQRPTKDDVDEAAREVYEEPTASASASAEIQGAMAALTRVVPLTRPGVPFAGATGVPDRYLEILQIADSPVWGHGWFRLVGARPGAAPDVKDLNRHLSRVLGGRFAIGYGGFGIVLALESKGPVVACEPYFGSLVKIADGLPQMFEALANDAGVRAQICDPGRLRQALETCGPLADGEVFDPGAQDAQKVSLIALWASASPLPKG